MKQSHSLIGLLTLAAMAASANAATLTAYATADTYLRGGSADQAYGATDSILFGSHSTVGPFTGLLRFDLSSLPVGATIDSVTLKLTSTNNGSGASVVLSRLPVVTGQLRLG